MSELSPFSCVATPDFVCLLHELRASIVISTYQAGKVIFLSPKNDRDLIQFPRSFKKAMGIALSEQKLAIATQNEVVVYSNSPGQAKQYPKKPNVYDALYIPRATYYTGELDIHDIHFTTNGLLAVNTRFSCVSAIDDNFSFMEVWRPSFISELQPGDYCHLNGMVVVNDKPKYLTALGSTNSAKGWRTTKANGGILIDADSQEFILNGLPMPHSPRLYKEGLFVLLSATGELARVDIGKQSYEVVYRFNGFVRGMDRIGDFLFIGLSKLRTTSASFGDLPIAAHSPMSGVAVFHLPSGKLVAQLKYETSVEEIYEVKVLQNSIRPSIMSIGKNDHDGVITVPDGVFWPLLTPISYLLTPNS
jgi:uncharacterized protein (TIGR03032 family)